MNISFTVVCKSNSSMSRVSHKLGHIVSCPPPLYLSLSLSLNITKLGLFKMSRNVLKAHLKKSHIFVPFGDHLTQFEANSHITDMTERLHSTPKQNTLPVSEADA